MTFWHIALLGGLRAEQQGRTITRFRTRKTASLLAFLAYHNRMHPRDELAELLWQDSDSEAARVSLRTALASLRKQLEPPGTPANSILLSDRLNVGLNPAAISTDVARYEEALRAADAARGTPERDSRLGDVVRCYGGTLLPGFYEDWLLVERQRLEERYQSALSELAERAERAGDMARALDFALRAASSDPASEPARQRAIRLYQEAGRPSAALRQYQELARRLRDEIGVEPSPDLQAMVAQGLGAPGPATSSARGRGRRVNAAPAPHSPPSPPSPLSAATPGAGRTVSSLPRPLTSFFGREDQLERVMGLVSPPAAVRLLTLTGPGGSGKTRTAIEAAQRLRDAYRGAAWFVGLADVLHGGAFLPAVRSAMRPGGALSEDPLEDIAGIVAGRPALLVLDNFEQLAPDAARELEALLQRAGEIVCIVTSRVQVGIEGERAIGIPSLPAPSAAVTDLVEMLEYPSVRLFVDRAQAARADFQLTAANAAAVGALCRRLEGLPLAVELAASWAQVLTPAQMLERTESGLKALSHRRKGVAFRHQSLAATAEWSFRLLSPELKRLFACLSVFRGGWSAKAAAAVQAGGGDCEADGLTPEESVLDGLARLAEASLILPEERATEEGVAVRFRMLETLREFADEQLREPERAVVHRRHAECFRRMAENLDRALGGPGRHAALQAFETDVDNLRAALEWSAANAPDIALSLSTLLYRYWDSRGYFHEGRQWILAALESAHGVEAPGARSRALFLAARFSWRLGDYSEARRLVEQSLSIPAAGEDHIESAGALNLLGTLLLDGGEVERARATFSQSLALFRRAQDHAAAARVLHNLGIIDAVHGDLSKGRSLLVQSILMAESAGSAEVRMTAMMSLAEVVAAQGDMDEARRLYREVLEWARAGQDAHRSTNALKGLARLEYLDGRYAPARSMCLECMAAFEETGERAGIAACLSLLGQIAAARGDYALARQRLQQSLRLYADLNLVAEQGVVVWCFACLAAREGRFDDAARLMGAEEGVRDRLGTTVQAAYRAEHTRFLETTRAALGEAAFAEAWEEGRGTSLEVVVRQLLFVASGDVPAASKMNSGGSSRGRRAARS
jgi:predicted ATPase/DNA-binding SARP family transcriptional activator